MISTYLTDQIDIIQTSYDIHGGLTETTISDVAARVEDINSLVNDSEGKEVTANMLVIINNRELRPQWKIKIKIKNGRAYYQPNKKWEILAFEQLNMMGLESHIEIKI